MSNHASNSVMRAIVACVEARVPVIIWGDPGVGKTSLIGGLFESWKFWVETVIGSVREVTDFMGFPKNDGSYTDLAWAQRLNDADRALLFLDEMTCSDQSVQKAIQRISQERYVGETKLEDSVSIIAAANPPDIATDGWDLSAPVANRFVHLDWQFDPGAWLDGMASNFEDVDYQPLASFVVVGDEARARSHARATGMVTGFLRHRPDLLNPGVPSDPEQSSKAWASPRAWTNAARAMSVVRKGDNEVISLLMKGCVGEAAAMEFMVWSNAMDLHDPMEVLADPSIVDWKNDRPDRLYALLSSIEAYVSTSVRDRRSGEGPATWSKAMKVLTACAAHKPDIATPSAERIINMKPEDARITAASRRAFAPIMERLGRFEAVEDVA